jgi:hypothetical protein
MVNQPDASELEPYADDLYQAVARAIPRWISTQVAEIASLSIDETSSEFQSALADVTERTRQVASQLLLQLKCCSLSVSNPRVVMNMKCGQCQVMFSRLGH